MNESGRIETEVVNLVVEPLVGKSGIAKSKELRRENMVV